MSRYADWMRRIGAENATPMQIDEAKRLLGFVMLRARSLGLHQYRLHRFLEDGTRIIASYIGGQPQIEIQPVVLPVIEAVQEAVQLWTPRGFVVYPSTKANFGGWGQPAVYEDSVTPWSTAWLAPGLISTNWTPDGPLGEVLISKDLNAGYPSQTKPVGPLFFEKSEVRSVLSAGRWIAPRVGAWKGYRSEYVDYTQAPASGHEFFSYVNSQRDDPFTPWFRGYFEEAVYLSEKVPPLSYDGANPTIPSTVILAGYGTASKRLAKDGFLATGSADAITSDQTTVENIASAFDGSISLFGTDFDQSCQLGFGLQGNVSAVEAAKRNQWIAYGNMTWVGTDPGLPILSWDSNGEFQLPYYMITLPFFFDPISGHMQPYGGTTVSPYPDYTILADLSDLKANIRGKDKPFFTKNLYARGRVIGRFSHYVFGASVQVITQPPQNAHDRLLVLMWDASDQDVYMPTGGGDEGNPPEAHIMRKLRLYFCDIPSRNGLRLDPDHALTDDDMTFAGYIPTTDYSEEHAYPTLFPRQMPRFSPDGTKLIHVVGEYVTEEGVFAEIFTHDLVEFVLTGIDDGGLSFTQNTYVHGEGGPNVLFPQQSYEAVDYDSSNNWVGVWSYLVPWPYEDLFPGSGVDATRDTRVLSRTDGSGQLPYATELGESIDPQCVAAYYGTVAILDVVHYAVISTYLTGNCFTPSAWSSRLIVLHEGVRISDSYYPQDSTNRIYGGNPGYWMGGSYARIGDDWILTVEHGAFESETYIVTGTFTIIVAPATSRITGYINTTLENITDLVGGDADCLVPAGVV